MRRNTSVEGGRGGLVVGPFQMGNICYSAEKVRQTVAATGPTMRIEPVEAQLHYWSDFEKVLAWTLPDTLEPTRA